MPLKVNKKSNYKQWAKALKRAGYATKRTYAEDLIAIIEKYELYQYDI
jgi:flagellum-specific peptidoglycan hydrolase FlgJ